MFAMGYAVTTYDGYFDPDPKDDLLTKGMTVHMTFFYQRDTAFESLMTEYFVALCVASTLLFFSCVPIIYVTSMKYLEYRRRKQVAVSLINGKKLIKATVSEDESVQRF